MEKYGFDELKIWLKFDPVLKRGLNQIDIEVLIKFSDETAASSQVQREEVLKKVGKSKDKEKSVWKSYLDKNMMVTTML